jgi:hypothetical protein
MTSSKPLKLIGVISLNPDQNEYIREFCPGEFGAAELPDIPPGFRYATVVTVIHRTNGVADGRRRRMIAVCDT